MATERRPYSLIVVACPLLIIQWWAEPLPGLIFNSAHTYCCWSLFLPILPICAVELLLLLLPAFGLPTKHRHCCYNLKLYYPTPTGEVKKEETRVVLKLQKWLSSIPLSLISRSSWNPLRRDCGDTCMASTFHSSINASCSIYFLLNTSTRIHKDPWLRRSVYSVSSVNQWMTQERPRFESAHTRCHAKDPKVH